ncbi:MAG: hypothetical protein AAFU79_07885 [Myxococcota bacterium]
MITELILSLIAGADPSPPSTSPRIAIVELRTEGVPKPFARGLAETVATTVERTGVFESISPAQVGAVLAFNRRRELTGGCLDEDCYSALARAVRADHVVGGQVSKVGDTLSLELVLVDAASAATVKRVGRQVEDPSALLDQAREGTVVLLSGLLAERQGFLKVDGREGEAQVWIDDERRPEGIGQALELPAGPHLVKVTRDGFYPATADVRIRPGELSTVRVDLVPAAETVAAYNSQANLLRVTAWSTGAAAVVSTALSAFFYAQATDDKNLVDTFAGSTSLEQQSMDRAAALSARDSFDTNQALYLTFLGTAIVTGLTSAGLFTFGPDPGRYREFEALSSRE